MRIDVISPDPHRTVDDAPFGGGAGMVMKADVWGAALDELLTPQGVLIIPSPAGQLLSQPLAHELAEASQLVFACGRYEGIDARVAEHFAARGFRVLEVSLGDYVLNGGEVAALAIIEAVTRLLPGFMGNAESIVEESHAEGLLEHPAYTRPASWRGLDVPEVLLTGHHANVAAWRRAESERRTRERRPDLLPPG
jgi:tRNA (guanine37-N1)-methyltransferase